MKVIVFALHGCPLAALGPYGNEWIATPNLDRLAAEGVVFDQHLSDCPDPAAAGRAWRTGRHQWPPFPPAGPAPEPGGDLLAYLAARGVRTVLLRHTRPENDAPADFASGWSEVHEARPDPADPSPIAALLRVLPGVLDRFAEVPEGLLWVEMDRLLPPWDAPQDVFEVYVEELVEEGDEGDEEPDAEPVQPWTDPPTGWFDREDLPSWELVHRSLAAAVTAFDADLGRVFDLLRARGLAETATWVFTADHGFPLGEHGQIGRYRPWLHEELVHLPLILRLAGGEEAGRRIAALTQPADLAVTLADWFGCEPLPAAQGLHLAPLIRGELQAVREFVCTGLTLGSVSEWAIRTPHWAFLLPGPTQPEGDDPREPLLFEKPDDRWEVNDLRPRNLERSEELEQQLRLAVTPPP